MINGDTTISIAVILVIASFLLNLLQPLLNGSKSMKESLLKANMKLDQVCATTNETRSDIKSLNRDMVDIDRRVSVMERDLKTAFNEIDELKEAVKHE